MCQEKLEDAIQIMTDAPISPTLAKVLDAFLKAMKADEAIQNDAATRLDTLFRSGENPKQDEIDAALFPPEGDEAGVEESGGT